MLPEQLKNSRDWKGFKLSNGHLIREMLVYDFGKYEIFLSCRYSSEHEDWLNIRYSYGPSCFVQVLYGEIEVAFGESHRKKKDNKRCSPIVLTILREGSSFYLSNSSSVIIFPTPPVVYTLSISVRMPKMEEKLLEKENLSPDRIDELVSIFRGYFPAT